MQHEYDQLPFAAPAVIYDDSPRRLPIGTSLCPVEAQAIFQHHYIAGAGYTVCSDGYARRHVAQNENLGWYFDGAPCRNGHIAPRRFLRPPPRGSECRICVADGKRRARRKAR